MTENLHAKFTGLESQLATQHAELMDALNTIAYALGAPPSAPTITLADVVEALNVGNLLLATGNTTTAGIRTDLNAQLDSVGLQLDTANNNASTNTQALIKAIYATFCDCVTTNPILPPPLDVTPTPLADDEKCRRVQFYISLFTSWLAKIANYTATGASLSSGVLEYLLAASAAEAGLVVTAGEAGTLGGPPGVALAAAIAAIAGAVYLLGSAILNDYLTDFQSPIFQHALLEAMYAANSADEGQAAFESVVGANFAAIPAGILAFLWWSQWSNDMYSDTPVVDTSAFDGSICKPDLGEVTECTIFNSTPYALSGVGTFEVIISPPSYSGNVIFTGGNFEGYSVRVVSNPDLIDIRVDHYNSSDGYVAGVTLNAVDSLTIYNEPTNAIGIHSNSPTASIFSIELCPPA